MDLYQMNIDDQASEDAKPYNRMKRVQKKSSLSSWEDLDDDHHDDNRNSFKEIPNNLEQRNSKEDLDSNSIWVSTQKDIKAQNPNIRFNIKKLAFNPSNTLLYSLIIDQYQYLCEIFKIW